MNFLFDELTDRAVTDARVREAAFHLFVKVRLLGRTVGGCSVLEHQAMRGGGWFQHTKSWVKTLRKNVLILFYEDVSTNHSVAIRTVAHFMGCELSDKDVGEVAEACSQDVMAGDPRFKCGIEARLFGLGASVWKVRSKDYDAFKSIDICSEDRAEISRLMFENFGFRSYEEMKEDIKRRQFEMFQR